MQWRFNPQRHSLFLPYQDDGFGNMIESPDSSDVFVIYFIHEDLH